MLHFGYDIKPILKSRSDYAGTADGAQNVVDHLSLGHKFYWCSLQNNAKRAHTAELITCMKYLFIDMKR